MYVLQELAPLPIDSVHVTGTITCRQCIRVAGTDIQTGEGAGAQSSPGTAGDETGSKYWVVTCLTWFA